MQLEKLQAFVLSNSLYGDSDKIVSLFTLERGRLKGFARAARNSRKRFGPALETFARIDLYLDLKDGLSTLKSADVVTIFSGIRRDLAAIAHALYLCELVECLTPEEEPLPRLYRLMSVYLQHLDSGHIYEADRRMFEINMLNILGYCPSLKGCSRCGNNYDERGAFALQGGELVCRFCTKSGRNLPSKALSSLKLFLGTGQFGVVTVDNDALAAIGALLDELLLTHSTRKFKSLDFLQQAFS